MSDILRDFDKKNEFPSGLDSAIFDFIADDIRDRRANAIAMEFTKCIGELLKKNGITPKITEYTREIAKEHSIEQLYGVSIDELDFSEHDKTFVDRIVELQIKNNNLVDEINKLREIINKKLGGWNDYGVSFEEIFGMRDENKELKQITKGYEDKIASLEENVGYYKDSLSRVEKNCDKLYHENKELKQRIAELESKNNQLTESILRKETKIHELESKETENTVEVRFPASPIEIATYLINNICTINELKMIAEHINVYCNGGK